MKHTRKKSKGMTKHMLLLPMFLVAAVALVLGGAATELSAWHWPGLIKYEDAEFFTEVNYTDKDIGVQAFVDGEAWKWLKIVAPNGRIFYVEAKGNLREIGLTELRYESDEPQFAEVDGEEADMSLAQFLEMFPRGRYRFYGCTVEGDLLRGKAKFTHDIPCAPVVTLSRVLNGTTIRISWDPVTNKLNNWKAECDEKSEINIVGYQAIVECEDEDGNVSEFSVDLRDDAGQVTVPPKFFEELTAVCKAEVLAIEESGNRTITETDEFCVEEGEFIVCPEDDEE